MLWHLLRKNISPAQMVGYAVANLIGLVIIMCAIRFYSDVSGAYRDEDSFVSRDFLVISKKVSGLNTLGLGGDTDFSDAEVEDLSRRPWVRRVGAFTAADFTVRASIDFGQRSMSSFLFLESIPDQFLDVEPDQWHWEPGDNTVPVIISKDYLALYNFGFAATQGLPQLSESIISKVPLVLTLSGAGRELTFNARIVGFSSRLNTIAVPQQFMDYANNLLAPGQASKPSRLIIEVNTPGDPAIDRFMDRNGYEVAGDKLDNGRANYFMTLVTAVIVTVGAVITALSLFILVLSIFLLIQKNRQTMRNLILLGYTPRQVARPYMWMVLIINGATLLLGIAIMLAVAGWWQPRLAQLGLTCSAPWPTIALGTALTLATTTLSLLLIRLRTSRL